MTAQPLSSSLASVSAGISEPWLKSSKAELKASIADRELARGFHLKKEHIAFYLYELRKADHNDREVQKRLIQIFVNSVFVYDDCIKLTFNFSGDKRTVTLKMLQAAEAGEVFGRCALCSTTTHRYELFWFQNVFCLTVKIPWA